MLLKLNLKDLDGNRDVRSRGVEHREEQDRQD